jgi:Polymerase beta, Nucleotidyltransferase
VTAPVLASTVMTDPRLDASVATIRRHYGARLLAAVLFGSRARSRARQDSDWDLLLVLADDQQVRRRLYDEWDAAVAPAVEMALPGVSPHFVHLPAPGVSPSSLWLEAATAHVVLSDPTGRASTWLQEVRGLIAAGAFERRFEQGLPYWRRAG